MVLLLLSPIKVAAFAPFSSKVVPSANLKLMLDDSELKKFIIVICSLVSLIFTNKPP